MPIVNRNNLACLSRVVLCDFWTERSNQIIFYHSTKYKLFNFEPCSVVIWIERKFDLVKCNVVEKFVGELKPVRSEVVIKLCIWCVAAVCKFAIF